jgi:hypothetical protein
MNLSKSFFPASFCGRLYEFYCLYSQFIFLVKRDTAARLSNATSGSTSPTYPISLG